MSNFLNQSCKICINTNDGTLSERLSICYNELAKVISAKDIVTGADYTTAATITAIEEWLLTGTAPAGFTIEKRASCTVDYQYDNEDICMEDPAGVLSISGRVNEKKDVESKTVVDVTSFNAYTSIVAAIVEGDEYLASDNDVVYVSGSVKTKDLVLEIKGVEYTMAECVVCQNC